jgi:hypothetical protein
MWGDRDGRRQARGEDARAADDRMGDARGEVLIVMLSAVPTYAVRHPLWHTRPRGDRMMAIFWANAFATILFPSVEENSANTL